MKYSHCRGRKLTICLLVLLLLTLCGCNKNDKTVYVRDYTKVEFEGYSGYGSVIVTVDHKALNAALKKAGIESKVETCDTECSKEHVTNGDVVTISFSGFDDALTGNSNFKMDPLNVKVSGLKEGTVVDAFDGVEIKVGGISPKLELSINNPKAQYTFATKVIRDGVEKDYNDGDFLKTNDELVIKPQIDADALAKEGIVLEEYEKRYAIGEDVSHFLNAEEIKACLDEIDEKCKERIVSDALEVSNHMLFKLTGDYGVLGSNDGEKVEALNRRSAYYYVEKEPKKSADNNFLMLIYEGDISGMGRTEHAFFAFVFVNSYYSKGEVKLGYSGAFESYDYSLDEEELIKKALDACLGEKASDYENKLQ